MRLIADLHVHSRFARAVSKEMNIATLETWGVKKGVELIGAPDFSHPDWIREMKEKLEPAEPGLYKRKGSDAAIRFLLMAEISCVFTRGSGRRIHMLLGVPSFAVADTINAQLGQQGNLKSDGRPIIGIDVRELTKIALDASPETLVIPAHVWTPWFGMYGSKSGFDSMKECFGDLLEHIPAVETGLSSDPEMNWRMAELDTKSIVSFSDAHSAPNIGREATVLEVKEKSFAAVAEALCIPFPTVDNANRILMTVEFFPEEGMYHWDGHREHNIRWSPEDTKRHNAICPVCNKPVTVGVMNRVEELANRPAGYADKRRPPFQRIVPLAEIIGEALGVGKLSKSVMKEYDQLIANIGSEFATLLDAPMEQVRAMTKPRIADGIKRVREGKLHILPGYDGVYGTVQVFSGEENPSPRTAGQAALF